MKWKNLVYDCCPKCSSKLYTKDAGITCSGKGCDFFITHNKFLELKDKFGRDQRLGGKEFEGYGEGFD